MKLLQSSWVALTLIISNQLIAGDLDISKLEQYFDALDEHQKAMGSVYLSKEGQGIYQRSIGFANVDGTARADSNTVYRIGSITKTFTAVMIMQLVESGDLSLDQKVADFFPDLPNADKITVDNLLTHRSGLQNFTATKEFRSMQFKDQTSEQMLKHFEDLECEFEPGLKEKYSNTNYLLLGILIEKVTGESYGDNLRKRIAEPLGLSRTGAGLKIDTSSNHALSYRYTNGDWFRGSESNMSVPGGAGAISSTAREVNQFFDALFNTEKLVSKGTLKLMKPGESFFGRGLVRFPWDGGFVIGHNGKIDAFDSMAFYMPKTGVIYVALMNGLNFALNDITVGTLSLVEGKDYEIPDFSEKEMILSIEVLEKYEGTFKSGDLPLDIEVFVKDGKLMAQATGQSAFPLTAFSETEFRFDPSGIVIEFRDAERFILNQGGGKFRFKKE